MQALLPQLAPHSDPIESINAALSQAWRQVCPASQGPSKPLSQPQQQHSSHTQGLVRQLWNFFALKALAPGSYSVLRGWLLAAKLSRVQRLLHKACRLKKRVKLEAILSEAESSRHSHAIFSAIKRLAPKSRYQRVQFRDHMGCILSPAAEAATYFRGVYHSTHLHSPPDASAVLGMKFTAEELSFAFSKLQPRKALPNKFAPARLWKEASQLLVPYILPAVNLQHNTPPQNGMRSRCAPSRNSDCQASQAASSHLRLATLWRQSVLISRRHEILCKQLASIDHHSSPQTCRPVCQTNVWRDFGISRRAQSFRFSSSCIPS